MDEQEELEILERLASEVEKKVTKVKISSRPIAVDAEFGEIEENILIDEEQNTTVQKEFDCGCPVEGMGKNYAGRCFNHLIKLPREVRKRDRAYNGNMGRGRPLYLCKKHLGRCDGCGRKIVCVRCWKIDMNTGLVYCKLCYLKRKLGLKR